MRLFGLIGYPLDHSFSSVWFGRMFSACGITDAKYRNFPMQDIGELPALLGRLDDLRGFNVTIPHKQTIIPYLSGLSPDASQIGAVNCVTRSPEGLKGYNTDWLGFRRSLEGFIGKEGLQALVLGSGGSSKAVRYALESMGIRYETVSTSKSGNGFMAYKDIDGAVIASHRLIINTTPLGTFPDINECPPIPYRELTSGHFLFDLVYNPATSMFLQKGMEQGCSIRNGMEMLEEQAVLSWEIFSAVR